MKGNLTAAIAWRYLKAKKTHGAVGTISTVSLCALAVATAAIICVLSVFNGFQEVIGARLDTMSPDVMVTAAKGKTIADGEALAARIGAMEGVALATPTLSDNALLICNGKEMPVTLKGVVPGEYARVTRVKGNIPADYGEWLADGGSAEASAMGDATDAVLAVGTASRMGAYPGDGALIFAPRREGRVNLANPASSFLTDSVRVRGVYRAEQSQYDDDGLVMPLDAARRLFMYDTQASAVEVKARDGMDPAELASRIAAALGHDYRVRDRWQQQEVNFRMVNIEKWVSFLLLVFILVIAGFNIISSLSMLVIEKEDAIATLQAIGLSRRKIGAVFAWESIYVSAAGALAGVTLGVALCLLQQEFGIVKLAGGADATIVQAYPVKVIWRDILVTLVPISALGLATAAITAKFARSKCLESCKI